MCRGTPGVLGLEEEEDRDDRVREVVVDVLPQEHDPLTVHPVVHVDPRRRLGPREFVRDGRRVPRHHRRATRARYGRGAAAVPRQRHREADRERRERRLHHDDHRAKSRVRFPARAPVRATERHVEFDTWQAPATSSASSSARPQARRPSRCTARPRAAMKRRCDELEGSASASGGESMQPAAGASGALDSLSTIYAGAEEEAGEVDSSESGADDDASSSEELDPATRITAPTAALAEGTQISAASLDVQAALVAAESTWEGDAERVVEERPQRVATVDYLGGGTRARGAGGNDDDDDDDDESGSESEGGKSESDSNNDQLDLAGSSDVEGGSPSRGMSKPAGGEELGGGALAPPRTVNEVKELDLPVQSAPKHLTRGEELKLAGHVASVLDRLVVVAAAPGLPPMDEGSVLCVTAPPDDADADGGGDDGDGDDGGDGDGGGGEGGDDSDLRVLGCVSELFGPVSAPRR